MVRVRWGRRARARTHTHTRWPSASRDLCFQFFILYVGQFSYSPLAPHTFAFGFARPHCLRFSMFDLSGGRDPFQKMLLVALVMLRLRPNKNYGKDLRKSRSKLALENLNNLNIQCFNILFVSIYISTYTNVAIYAHCVCRQCCGFCDLYSKHFDTVLKALYMCWILDLMPCVVLLFIMFIKHINK